MRLAELRCKPEMRCKATRRPAGQEVFAEEAMPRGILKRPSRVASAAGYAAKEGGRRKRRDAAATFLVTDFGPEAS
jgi:hypothetical protein